MRREDEGSTPSSPTNIKEDVMVTTILIVWGVIGAISMLSSLYIIMTGNEGKVTPKGQAIPLLIVTTMMILTIVALTMKCG